MFEEVSDLVQSALDGFKVCLFSYGQTGAGKTHTMQGSRSFEGQGIIPRAISKVGVNGCEWAGGWPSEAEGCRGRGRRLVGPARLPHQHPHLAITSVTTSAPPDLGVCSQAAGAGVGVRAGGLLHRGLQRAAAGPAGRHPTGAARGWQDPGCAQGGVLDSGGRATSDLWPLACSLRSSTACQLLQHVCTLHMCLTCACPAHRHPNCLLACAENNAIQHQPNGGHTVVLGAARVAIESEADAELVTRKAAAARAVEATAMNAVSSRSHSGGWV